MHRLSLSALWMLAVAVSATAAWPIFRGGPLQVGVSAEALPDQLDVLWKVEIEEGIEGTATIVDGVVYAAGLDGHVRALNLADGTEKWKFKGDEFRVGPSVGNGCVYVGDTEGCFYCLDAATGRKNWTYKCELEITSSANFSEGNILFGCTDEHLYCLTPEGKKLWSFKVAGGPVLGSPVVADGKTFVSGCDSTLHVLDARNGKELRQIELEAQTGVAVAVRGDHAYLGTMNNNVLAIDLKGNRIAWRFETAKKSQPYYSSAAVTEELVLVGCRDKHLYAIDRKTGKQVWSAATRGKVDSSPVVAGSRVYVGSMDGNLYVYDLAKGTELAKIVLGKNVAASPAVSGGRLVIGTTDGKLYCLGSKK